MHFCRNPAPLLSEFMPRFGVAFNGKYPLQNNELPKFMNCVVDAQLNTFAQINSNASYQLINVTQV